MIPAIRERYSDRIPRIAAGRYGIAETDLQLLAGFESFLYAFSKEGGEYVLRIGHGLRRSRDMIRGEVDWINYLAANGVSVARAVPSAQGNLVEEIDDQEGGLFLATAFVRAPGRPVWERGGWNASLIERYGRLIGRMHALSKAYEPAKPSWRRSDWDDPVNLDLASWLSPSETQVMNRFQALMKHLTALPKDVESYGLIHQDAHAANLMIDDVGTITLFDFDDCVYGWYVYDLAMVLFYAVTNRDDAAEFGPFFWRHLQRGYRRENHLDPSWIQEIPNFLKLREIDLFGAIHRDIDPDRFGEDPWIASFMRGRRQAIVHDLPYISFPL